MTDRTYIAGTAAGVVLAAGALALSAATHETWLAAVGFVLVAGVAVLYSAWQAGDARTWALQAAGWIALVAVVALVTALV